MYEIKGLSFTATAGGNRVTISLRRKGSANFTTVVMPVLGAITKQGVLDYICAQLHVVVADISIPAHINFDLFKGIS